VALFPARHSHDYHGFPTAAPKTQLSKQAVKQQFNHHVQQTNSLLGRFANPI